MSRKIEGAIKNQHTMTIYKPGKRQQTKHTKIHKQRTNNMDSQWKGSELRCSGKVSNSCLLQYTHQPPYMFMKDTTHILVEKEKGLKHKKTSRNGKKIKVWNKQPQCSDCIYSVFFYSCTGMTFNTFFFYFSDDVMCPVRSFFIYKEHLNPKSDNFFQRQKIRPKK